MERETLDSFSEPLAHIYGAQCIDPMPVNDDTVQTYGEPLSSSVEVPMPTSPSKTSLAKHEQLAASAVELLCVILYYAYHSRKPRAHSLTGRDRLCAAVTNFTTRRLLDLKVPRDPEGTFIQDVSSLFVALARPLQVFAENARDVAIPVAEVLLQSNGWRLQPDVADSWLADISRIDLESKSCVLDCANAIMRFWQFTDDQCAQIPDEIENWRLSSEGIGIVQPCEETLRSMESA